MTSTRIALLTSIATTVAWTAKAVAIALAGGLGRSPLESPLFLIGFACLVVAAVATGVVLRPGAPGRPVLGPVLGRILGGAVGVVAVAVVGTVAGIVVTAVEPASPGWAWEEVNLWAMMLTLLATNIGLRIRATRRQPAPVAGLAHHTAA